MRSLLFVLLLGVLSVAQAKTFVVEDIRLEGLQRVSAGTVFEQLTINPGDSVSSADLASASGRLFATGLFNDLKIYRDGNVLIFQLVELPTITEVSLEGNKQLPDEALMDSLKQNGIAEGQVFKRATLERMILEIERVYAAQGRYDAGSEIEVTPLPRNRVKLLIRIKEGSVAEISDINIVGNEAFSDDELLKQFSLKSDSFWSWYSSDTKYNREKLTADLESLRSWYLDRGYIRFNIESTQVSLSPEKDGVYITINVKEGEVYSIRNVQLAGELIVDAEDLEDRYRIFEGDTFSRRLVTQSSDGMSRVLGNEGYTFAKVNGIPKIDDDALEVDLTYFVEPGRRTYVRSINFSGNENTKDEVLRREMLQMEGGWASTDKIEAGKAELNALGFFKSVTVDTPPVPGGDDLIDVNYRVEEQLNGSLNFNIGYAGGQGMIIGASVSQNNFLGSGDRMSLSVNKTDTQQSYNFSFSDPFYTIHGVSRGFNFFYRETDFEKLNTVSDYQTNTKGANVTFGYPISRYQRAGMSLGYSNTVMFEGNIVPAEITDFIDTEGRRFDEYTVGVNWRYTSLNHGMFPTDGMEQRLSLSAAVPGSDLTSYTLSYRSNYYFPLATDWSVRLRTELGYGNGYGDVHRLPFFKNFRSGGLGSVRGYRTNSLGPRGLPEYRVQPLVKTDSDGNVLYETDELGRPVVDASAPSIVYVEDEDGAAKAVANSNRYQPVYDTDASGSVKSAPSFLETSRAIGGNILTEASLELIFPIPFVEDRSSVRTVAFLDGGNTFTDQCFSPSDADLPNLTRHPYCDEGIDLGELRYSTGVGITWITAIGPLTFVYSVPLNDQRGDRTEGFEFSLGQSF